MKRWTQLDDILHEHVSWRPHEPYSISRAQDKDQSHLTVSGPKFTQLFSTNVENIVVAANAVFRLSVAWSVPEIFAIKVQSCPKSSALLITHEPLRLACCNFACTCTSTTLKTLFKFKVIGQRSRSHVFGAFLCVWYCGYPRTVLSLEQGLIIFFIYSFVLSSQITDNDLAECFQVDVQSEFRLEFVR